MRRWEQHPLPVGPATPMQGTAVTQCVGSQLGTSRLVVTCLGSSLLSPSLRFSRARQ